LVYPGLSSDYAAMIRAALALSEGTGDPSYLNRATAWADAVERHHRDSSGEGYFLTADDAEGLIVRLAMTADDATPNPNALMAQNMVRLAVLAGDGQYRVRVDRLFDALLPAAAENLFGHTALFSALDLRIRNAEIVCAGARAEQFAQAALRLPFLERTILRAPRADALPERHPARAMAASAPEEGAAFICQGERCSLPITNPAALASAITPPR
jgi:uncharacterized protein YyaL (SSP411 family)